MSRATGPAATRPLLAPLAIALLLRLLLAAPLATNPESAREPDSRGYFTSASRIRAFLGEGPGSSGETGSGGALGGGGPLYPVFIAVLGEATLPFQVFLSVVWIVPVSVAIGRVHGRRAGLAAAWLAALDPLTAMLSTMYLTECLAASLAGLALACSLRGRAILSGLLQGMVVATRPALLLILAPHAIRHRRASVLLSLVAPLIALSVLPGAGLGGEGLRSRAGAYLLSHAVRSTAPDRETGERLFGELLARVPPEDRLKEAARISLADPGAAAMGFLAGTPGLLFGASSESLARRLDISPGAAAVVAFRVYAGLHAAIVIGLIAVALRRRRCADRAPRELEAHLGDSIARSLLGILPALGPSAYGRFRAPLVPDLVAAAALAFADETAPRRNARADASDSGDPGRPSRAAES